MSFCLYYNYCCCANIDQDNFVSSINRPAIGEIKLANKVILSPILHQKDIKICCLRYHKRTEVPLDACFLLSAKMNSCERYPLPSLFRSRYNNIIITMRIIVQKIALHSIYARSHYETPEKRSSQNLDENWNGI